MRNQKIATVAVRIFTDCCRSVGKFCISRYFLASLYPWTANFALYNSWSVLVFLMVSTKVPPIIFVFGIISLRQTILATTLLISPSNSVLRAWSKSIYLMRGSAGCSISVRRISGAEPDEKMPRDLSMS